MEKIVKNTLNDASVALHLFLNNEAAISAVSNAGKALIECFSVGGRVFSCGNGGSMCDAMHFAEELSGRYRLDRKALPALAVSDPGHISCVGNDYGYSKIFSRYLEAHAKKGDILLAISTSGNSENVVAAAEYAKENGIKVIGLTGRNGSILGEVSDIEICTPVGEYADRIQELHIKVIHILIELVERSMFPENYKRK
jgi:D-sedoheptulose 7-phosphate isomerase